MKKQLLVLFLKYGLGLGLLVVVVCSYWHIDSPDGTEVGLAGVMERPIHWPYLVIAAVIAMASVLLTFVRWYLLVRAQGLPFTLASALRLGMIGYYLGTFLPGAIGGDLIKAGFIAREQKRRTVAVATVIIDRVVGLCGLVWLTALIGTFFWITGLLPNIATSPTARTILETIFVSAMGLLGGSVLFWLIIGFLSQARADRLASWLEGVPRIGGMLAEFWRAGWLYRCRGRSVGVALAMSLLSHLGFVLVFYFSSRTVNPITDMPSLQAHLLSVPVGMTISAGVPTPGNIGGSEIIYGELYRILGYAFAAGVLGSLVQRSISWLLGLAGYLVYLRMKPSIQSAPTSNGFGTAALVGAPLNENG